ncbi:MAG: DUF2182 domain-containing protein [Armatimonadota bacterium]|nr:DUF2182 domain-containing protein [Armatimonadota bacterium]MDR7444678.1 DUF2182 domain-containing protein [Armatimonadota bacterium]MDR7571043.1 DUF2182 domain-containing protein [Armatimonadota bacterium]MDR7613613.1 DUF2182 domain-containing protein [Armatimonadota bacterium]
MTESPALPQARRAMVAAVLLMAIAAWAVVVRQATGDDQMAMSPAVFLGSWTTMMLAMMLPSALPVLLTFDRIQAGRRKQGGSGVPTWVFLVGYLVVWTAFGGVALGVRELLGAVGVSLHGQGAAGVLLVLAGVYQFSPLKHACLGKCRSPLGFVLGSWRDGRPGAVRMGLEHGISCLGCCWALFLVLFPLGLMNLAAMAALTALVFAEKVLPAGPKLARATGSGLVAWGLFTLARAGFV